MVGATGLNQRAPAPRPSGWRTLLMTSIDDARSSVCAVGRRATVGGEALPADNIGCAVHIRGAGQAGFVSGVGRRCDNPVS